jgi:small nuclear ribonucleoprotein E
MSGRQGGGRRDKVLIPPINFIFRLLTSHAKVSIWLYEQLGFRIEGHIRVSGTRLHVGTGYADWVDRASTNS